MPRTVNSGGLEQLILMALARFPEGAYGVAVQREIEKRTGKAINVAAVYVTLERLFQKGYVSSWLGEKTQARGGRPKRYFKIEASGAECLKESLQNIEKMARGLEVWLEQ